MNVKFLRIVVNNIEIKFSSFFREFITLHVQSHLPSPVGISEMFAGLGSQLCHVGVFLSLPAACFFWMRVPQSLGLWRGGGEEVRSLLLPNSLMTTSNQMCKEEEEEEKEEEEKEEEREKEVEEEEEKEVEEEEEEEVEEEEEEEEEEETPRTKAP